MHKKSTKFLYALLFLYCLALLTVDLDATLANKQLVFEKFTPLNNQAFEEPVNNNLTDKIYDAKSISY